MNTAIVRSSHGEITINNATGNVIDFSNEEIHKEYGSLVRFDIPEYCTYWNESPADSYDILDLGSWNQNGSYEPADEDFRSDYKNMAN